MCEHDSQALLPRQLFLDRLVQHGVGAAPLPYAAFGLGMVGCHWLEDLSWRDSRVNAARILGGMGPVAELHTTGAKLLAGIVFLVAAAVIFAPVVHRAVHRFHLEDGLSAP